MILFLRHEVKGVRSEFDLIQDELNKERKKSSQGSPRAKLELNRRDEEIERLKKEVAEHLAKVTELKEAANTPPDTVLSEGR